jgi:ABC-type Fe3+-citrate transport system substrate-binding protein
MKNKNILDNVANLYAWAGIHSTYDEDDIKRFGQDIVDKAVEMSKKVKLYKKKIESMKKEIESSDEGQILLAVISHSRGYGGYHNTNSDVSDLFKFYLK